MILKIILVFGLASLSAAQESCPANNGMVGFTALTPEQLKNEIQVNIAEASSSLLEEVRDTLSEDTEATLKELNDTLTEALVRIQKLVGDLEGSLLSRVEAITERVLRQVLSEVIAELVTAQPPTAPVTIERPTTAAGTTERPTTAAVSTERPTTAAVSTERPTTAAPTTPQLPPIGLTPLNPALSCQQILEADPTAASGHYWLSSSNGFPVRVYCEMGQVCGGRSGGWVRAANLDMRDSSQSCPTRFKELTFEDPPDTDLRLCATVDPGVGCVSTTIPVQSVSYSQVCGRVLGYQDRTPNGFYPYHRNPSLTIDDIYVDGISLTQGSPRQHIWTFVAGLDESLGHLSSCECSNTQARVRVTVPPFVGSDYFCDTGSRDDAVFEFYPEDPLWDGEGCGAVSTCCQFNTPPWFEKKLAAPANEDLELRVCRDSAIANEDILFELVEIYVR